MTQHLITVNTANYCVHLWCERDETGKIIKMTAPSGLELKFSYYGEWVEFQGKTWWFNKDSYYGERIK